MDVDTGLVIAMQGGFSYQHSVFNRATQALRQPGSAFKPFVYAAALDSGYTPATIVVDAPIELNTPQGLWRPKNYSNRFYGPTPLRTGIEQSRNLMTIRLAEEVGMDTVASYAERFGVYDYMSPFLANSLGSEETTLYQMVSAYAMFANGGERVQPTLVDRVQDRFGRTVYRHDERVCNDCTQLASLDAGFGPRIASNRAQIMDPVTAYQLTSMMTGVVERGTAAGRVTLDGEPVKLTAQEYKLLSYLMLHKGKVVSRTELIEHIYDQDFDRDSNTIEVFVTRIRKKLGAEVITTIRGLGYSLDDPADAPRA